MTDIREALVSHLERVGVGYGLHDALKREVLGAWADAILAKFDVTPRGEGVTIEIGGRRAGKTQALAERVADEVMERGGSATVTSLPSVEDVARACGDPDSVTPRREGESVPRWSARAVLALLPGRSEAEVKAEAWDEVADYLDRTNAPSIAEAARRDNPHTKETT